MPRENKGPHVRPTPNEFGVYEIIWTVPQPGGKSRSKRHATGCKTFRQAQAYLTDEFLPKRVRQEADATGVPQLATVRDVLLAYKAGHVDHLKIDGSRDQCERWNLLLRQHDIANRPAHDVTDEDVKTYVRARVAGLVGWTDEEGKRHAFRVVKESSVRSEVSHLKAALEYCVKNKKWPAQLNRLTKPELEGPAQAGRREHWLERADVEKLLEAAKDPRSLHPKTSRTAHWRKAGAPAIEPLFLFIAVAMHTASRRQAILDLTWDRVTFSGLGGFIDFLDPGRDQTSKRRVTVPMSVPLATIMRKAWAARGGATFVIDPLWGIDEFRSHCKRVLGQEHGPHILRHSWATWAANAGIDMFAIAGVLGDSVATVIKHYAKHMPTKLKSTVDLVSAGDEAAPPPANDPVFDVAHAVAAEA